MLNNPIKKGPTGSFFFGGRDKMGIKGRLQTGSYENAEKQKVYYTEVVAERVTFLSSSKQKENEEVKNEKINKKKKAD